LLCNTDSREEEERAFLDDALSRRLDGVVFAGFWVQPEELLVLANAGMAVVNLGHGAGPVDSVYSGDQLASAQMTGYLLSKYGPDVALIDGDERAMVSQARAFGFAEAHRAANSPVPPTYVVSEEFTREGGRRGMERLLDLPNPPRAVFCANDRIALGALDVARERSLAVPEDLAIAGYDDIEAASLVVPPLTTVRNQSYELGVACGELLLSRMTGEYTGESRTRLVQAELIERESA
ncbi:MAG: substrate-binding domain-containing protein, partial [Leifsonia sp.]